MARLALENAVHLIQVIRSNFLVVNLYTSLTVVAKLNSLKFYQPFSSAWQCVCLSLSYQRG